MKKKEKLILKIPRPTPVPTPFTQVIADAHTLGEVVRKVRNETGMTQAEAAAMCRVGTRFLSDLENGKPTLRLSSILQVLNVFGLVMTLRRRTLE